MTHVDAITDKVNENKKYDLEKSKQVYKKMVDLYNHNRYAELISEYSNKIDYFNESYLFDVNFILASCLHIVLDSRASANYYIKALAVAIDKKDVKNIIITYIRLAVLVIENNDYTIAKYYIEKAEGHIRKLNERSAIIEALNLYISAVENHNIGDCYRYYDLIKTDTFIKKYANFALHSKIMGAYLHMQLKNYDTSLKQYLSILDVYANSYMVSSTRRGADVLKNIALIYFEKKDYINSLRYIDYAINFYKKLKLCLEIEILRTLKFKINLLQNNTLEAFDTASETSFIKIKPHDSLNYNLSSILDDYIKQTLLSNACFLSEDAQECQKYASLKVYDELNQNRYELIYKFARTVYQFNSYRDIYFAIKNFVKGIDENANVELKVVKKDSEFFYIYNKHCETNDYESLQPISECPIDNEVIKTEKTLHIKTDKRDYDFITNSGVILEVDLSYVFLPLVFDNDLMGILSVVRGRNTNFSESDVKILETVGHIVSLAISTINKYNIITKINHSLDSIVKNIDMKSVDIFEIEEREVFTNFYTYDGFKKSIVKRFNYFNPQLELTFLFMEFDNFKLFNYKYGNTIGDEFIVILSKICRKYFENFDYIPCRCEGNFFVFLFFDIDLPTLKKMLNSIKENILKLSTVFKTAEPTVLNARFVKRELEDMVQLDGIIENGKKLLRR